MNKLRTFEHWPENSICPICKSSHDNPCTLIPKEGTQDGNICEALPVHVDCLNTDGWRYFEQVIDNQLFKFIYRDV